MIRKNGMALVAAAGFALLMALPLLALVKADRVVVCTAVDDREPSGTAASFPATTVELFCFSELSGAEGTAEVTHVWSKDGKEVFRQTLPVKAAHWRTWSRKRVSPGAWKVAILDPSGNELGSVSFTVGG